MTTAASVARSGSARSTGTSTRQWGANGGRERVKLTSAAVAKTVERGILGALTVVHSKVR